jgi:hypothetical protein
MTTLCSLEPEDNDGENVVPIGLSPLLYKERAIGTTSPIGSCGEYRAPECMRGIGALLREEGSPKRGRDVQLPCKRRTCSVCGPKKQATKCRSVLRDFGREKMYAVVVDDGSKEWEALHKSLERSGARYHRVPAPDGKAVVITTAADVGDEVADPESFVAQVVGSQPCFSEDKRRMTSSRPWKGAGDVGNHRWKRVGTTHMPLGNRVRVYQEEGCEPTEVSEDHRPPDVVAAHDVKLPEPASPEMTHLAHRLQLTRDEPPPEGMSGWGKALW